MIDRHSLAELASQTSRDDTSIMACKAASGAVKELAFCHRDRCFFVKVGGRERMRSDSLEVVLPFFNGPSPE
jgi:hypothetical protein